MDTSDWLQQYAPGFEALCDEERQRINEFSLLWSLFEAKALNENGSANAIVELAKQWARRGQLTADPFSQEFAYFRDRYVADGAVLPSLSVGEESLSPNHPDTSSRF